MARLSAMRVFQRAPKKVWPPLAAPIFGDDNRSLAIAYSLLHGLPMRDGEPVHLGDIAITQARDIVRWLGLSTSPSAAAAPSLPEAAGGDFSSEP